MYEGSTRSLPSRGANMVSDLEGRTDLKVRHTPAACCAFFNSSWEN